MTQPTVPAHASPAATWDAAHCSCGHSAERHDKIATTYCQATLLNSIVRGCICRPQP